MEKKNRFLDICLSLLTAILYFGIWFAVQIIFTSVIAIARSDLSPSALENFINSKSVELTVISNCACVLIFAFICKYRNSSLSEKASINKMPPRFVSNSIIMGITFSYAVAFLLGILVVIGVFPDSWVKMQEENASVITSAAPGMVFLFTVIMAPVLEEILCRGLILGTLKKTMHPWVAIVISSVMFGVAHGTPIGIIYATGLGIFMGWLAVKFNSIIPSMIFHMAYNATVSYANNPYDFVVLASIPILIFEIIDINRYFRGKKR